MKSCSMDFSLIGPVLEDECEIGAAADKDPIARICVYSLSYLSADIEHIDKDMESLGLQGLEGFGFRLKVCLFRAQGFWGFWEILHYWVYK